MDAPPRRQHMQTHEVQTDRFDVGLFSSIDKRAIVAWQSTRQSWFDRSGESDGID
jgi:hypothetical protein